jgi:hypothetical protein
MEQLRAQKELESELADNTTQHVHKQGTAQVININIKGKTR